MMKKLQNLKKIPGTTSLLKNLDYETKIGKTENQITSNIGLVQNQILMQKLQILNKKYLIL